MKEKLNIRNEWDKVFSLNNKVNHKKVTFKNHFGITLVADMYEPKDYKGKLPALTVSGPYGAVKEQASGLYAQEMVERGSLTIAFDPSFTGESGGTPRYMTSFDINVEDYQAAGDYITGCKMMENALKEGEVKSIGISNFYGERLNNLLNNAEIKPAVTQVETHPYYPQNAMKEKLNEYGTKIQAWYPLGGRGNDSVLTEEVIKDLANKYGKSPAQIILRWHNQKGVIVIPGSKNPEHIKDNLNIFDFEISEEDMKKIDELDGNAPFYNQTDESLDGFAKWNPDFDAQK